MAFTFLARMKVKPECDAEFADLCRQMEALVKQHEPRTLHYQFFRLDEPHGFAVLESFEDEAADEEHRNAPHSQAIIARMIACLDGGYTREYLRPL
jgi:autoinducer 2-degrading protein